MRYRVLGRTGIEVSVHCLGAMMFGAVGDADHDDCVRTIHAALDQGVNFVDTADMYSAGEPEEIVGKALQGRRDDVVLATKVHFQMGEGRNRSGNSRRWIASEEARGLPAMDLSAGRAALHPARFDPAAPANAAKYEAVEQLVELADGIGCSLPELAVAFAAEHPAVTSVIIGPRTMAQLESLLKGASLTLDDAALDRIDEIVPPGTNVYHPDGVWRSPYLTDAAHLRRPLAQGSAG
ncbi:aldo/keto reductase [Kitasatospora sp. HPMI-4]|uniref:aldo/keto reductase n=1 Tax=Kitasatospora sp. HPMI-4 TaxID=3448443 RepID=UPI003F1BCBD0